MIRARPATAATSDALATPQPPSVIGRVACTSEHGRAHHDVPLACWVAVTPSAKAALWRSGKVRRASCTCGPKQDRVSAWVHWVC